MSTCTVSYKLMALCICEWCWTNYSLNDTDAPTGRDRVTDLYWQKKGGRYTYTVVSLLIGWPATEVTKVMSNSDAVNPQLVDRKGKFTIFNNLSSSLYWFNQFGWVLSAAISSANHAIIQCIKCILHVTDYNNDIVLSYGSNNTIIITLGLYGV